MLAIETHPALEELERELAEVEAEVNKYSLADAIREGSGPTKQATTWIVGENVCALSAAYLALRARGLV